MKMSDKKIEIKQGINLHQIETSKFKTNLFAIFLSVPLKRDTITKNALIAAILRRGTKSMPTQQIISEKLEEMYGAGFDCGIEKTGDSHTLKFYLETINDEFLPQKEDLLQQALNILFEIVFNPVTENGIFKEEYVQGEKQNLKQIIEAKIDNKASYALERCIEEMYKNSPYGLYKYGYIEDIDKISSKDLYNYYEELIKNCKIDIFASGTRMENLQEVVENNEIIQNLKSRKPEKIETDIEKEKIEKPNIIDESMQITQGKLVIGIDILSKMKDVSYVGSVYNAILGGGSNSKLFQNVREKASLAYTCGSSYIKRKQNILIKAGIEIENYNKAIDIIEKQLEDMKNGNFNEEDIERAKKLLISSIDSIDEEQDTQITYYLGQELAETDITIEEYKKKIIEINKNQILELANSIQVNTIYFLKD